VKEIRTGQLLIMQAKALIIGCTGQDGSLLIKYLLNKNYEIIGTSRREQQKCLNHQLLGINNQFKVKIVNPLDYDEVKNILIEEEPTEVYHLSAQSSVGLSFQKPIDTQQSISLSTLNLLEACKNTSFKGRVFFAGSSEIYGHTISPAKINSRINPQSPYGIAKVESMLLVRNYRKVYNLNVVTGILFPHESPLRNDNFLTHKIICGAIKCLKNKNHKINLGNIKIERDWGWAEDYMEAIHLVNNSTNIKDQIICTGTSTSIIGFISITCNKLNLKWQDHFISNKKLYRAMDIDKSIGDPSQILNDLNWKATLKIEEIIEKLIESKLKYSS